jgi:hypothetical protein
MQILIALIVGASIGIGIHFHVTARSTRGVVVGPMVGALAAGIVWMTLTWLGVGIDSVWLWLSAIVAPIVVTYPVLITLSRVRTSHDARERARLKIS